MSSYKIILFKHKTLSNGEHPVLLQVIHARKRKVSSIGITSPLSEWNEEQGRFKPKSPKARYKNRVLSSIEERVEDYMLTLKKDNTTFSFTRCFQAALGTDNHQTVIVCYNEIIDELQQKKKNNTRSIYISSRNVLFRYASESLSFDEIDYTFLKGYEAFLLRSGSSNGGANHHMRTLRAVVNEGIKRGYLRPEAYPFSSRLNPNGYSFSHLKSDATPRALTQEEMDRMKNLDLSERPELLDSYNLFMFSYYARGMNFTDICRVKHADIRNGRLVYNRSKTSKALNQKLSEPLKAIIEEYEDVDQEYIFPILSSFHKTESQKTDRIKKKLKQLNRDLKAIATIAGIETNLTSYVARHTYATTLKEKGMSVEIISEALGHADISTTKAYLKKFSNEVLDKTDDLL